MPRPAITSATEPTAVSSDSMNRNATRMSSRSLSTVSALKPHLAIALAMRGTWRRVLGADGDAA